MDKFARHTRQSEDESPTRVGRKYLAVHMNVVPAVLVYTHVADDFKVTDLRTHSPALHSYAQKCVDPETFVTLMKNGYPAKQPPQLKGEFGRFCKTLFPKRVGEEAWLDYHRDDHWKKRAYFLAALNFKNTPQFHTLIRHIAGVEDVSALCKQLQEYTLAPHVDHKALAEEIGTMINQMSIECGVCGGHPESPPHSEEEEEVAGSNGGGGGGGTRFSIVGAAPPLSFDDPIVDEYRKRSGLSVTFPRSKLVKQMILSSVGVQADESLMSVHQKEFAPVSQEAWPTLLQMLPPNIEIDANSAAIQDFCKLFRVDTTKPVDARAFVKAYLTVYTKEGANGDKTAARYLKSHPTIDPSILKALL